MNKSYPKKYWMKNFIVLSVLLLSNLVFSQSVDSTNYLKQSSNILLFADYLFCGKDYLRALDEYENYLSKIKNDTIQFKIGLAYSRMADYNKSNEIFSSSNWSGQLRKSAKAEVVKNYFLEKKFSYMDSLKQALSEEKNSYPSINQLCSFSKLYEENFPGDGNPLLAKENFSNAFLPNLKDEIYQFYDEKTSLPYRSPTFAAILSAIIPGAGKIYSSQYTDGFTSLLVTGVLSFISYDNFKADHKFRGWLFGGLAAYFYAGNIYGSAAAAQIFNAEVSFNFSVKLDSFIKKQNYFIPKYDFICE